MPLTDENATKVRDFLRCAELLRQQCTQGSLSPQLQAERQALARVLVADWAYQVVTGAVQTRAIAFVHNLDGAVPVFMAQNLAPAVAVEAAEEAGRRAVKALSLGNHWDELKAANDARDALEAAGQPVTLEEFIQDQLALGGAAANGPRGTYQQALRRLSQALGLPAFPALA